MKRKIKEADRIFLQAAISLAADGIGKGGGPFGAVVTRKGKVISGAYNEVVYSSDPTAHAEILAIRKAAEILGTHDLSGCSLYASCEPCPMCLGAVYWSGIREVFFASDRKDASDAGFRDEEFHKDMERRPDERIISLTRISEIDGTIIFRLWENHENKITY